MKKPPIVHPFLFAGYIVLFLFAHNFDLSSAADIARPALVLLTLVSLSWLLLRRLPLDRLKIGILLSLSLFFMFTYGHVGSLFGEFVIVLGDFRLGQARAWFLTWLILLVLVSVRIGRTKKDLAGATRVLNAVSLILLLLPVGEIFITSPPVTSSWNASKFQYERRAESSNRASTQWPDIYYIVLDGYGRADMLRELYGYDNAYFISELSRRGFYVADRSRSNYAQTLMSVASSLNLLHLHDIALEMGSKSVDRSPLVKAIRDNNAVSVLRQYDYEYTTFTSGYSGIDVRSADRDMRAPWSLNEYEATLLSMTPVVDVLYGLRMYDPWEMHRRRLKYVFDALPKVKLSNHASFIFAHIMLPHPPFVFDERGQKVHQREINPNRYFTFRDGIITEWDLDIEEYRRSYIAQLRFTNRMILEAVDQILATSARPPVIILQGDHGPRSLLDLNAIEPNPSAEYLRERMSILNAYFIPAGGNELLYPDITPVNSFRVILRHVFGMNLEFLPDRSYYTGPYATYEFVDVTDIVTDTG